MRLVSKGVLRSVITRESKKTRKEYGMLQMEVEDNGRFEMQELMCSADRAHELEPSIGEVLEIPLNVSVREGRLNTFVLSK